MQKLSFIAHALCWILLTFVDPLQTNHQETVLVPRDHYNARNYQFPQASAASIPSTSYYKQQYQIQPFTSEAQNENRYYDYGHAVTSNSWIKANPYSQYYSERSRAQQANTVNALFAQDYATAPPLLNFKGTKNSLKSTDAGFKELEAQYIEKKTREAELERKMKELDELLSDKPKNDVFDENNRIEDKASISEESKRIVRQVRKEKPGFFWTLAKLAFETYNDTRSAYQQISQIINNNLAPETTTREPVTSNSLMNTRVTTMAPAIQNQTNQANITVTTQAPPTTTEPYRLTRTELQGIIRRNLRGLVRLFNIEWSDAINQSDITIKEFQRDLGKQVGVYLKDNPDVF